MATTLDINLADVYNVRFVGFADVSSYGATPSGVTFEITPPGWKKALVTFYPGTVNLYNANNLNIDCDSTTPLPDGQYDIRYSVTPNNINYIEKSFFRTALIKCKYQRTLLAIDSSCTCNGLKTSDMRKNLSDVRILIEGCIASSNQCDFTSAFDKYQLADKILERMKLCGC